MTAEEERELELSLKRQLESALGFKPVSLDEESKKLRRFGSVEESVRLLSIATRLSSDEILAMPVEVINIYLDELESLFIRDEIPCQKRFLN